MIFSSLVLYEFILLGWKDEMLEFVEFLSFNPNI